MAKLNKAIARKVKGSKRYNRLIRAKIRMKAKHQRVILDPQARGTREDPGSVGGQVSYPAQFAGHA